MTTEQAFESLKKYSHREHRLVYKTTGPSHGDPGGYSIPDREASCSKWKIFGWNDATIDPTQPCNCGADTINLITEDALKTLREALP